MTIRRLEPGYLDATGSVDLIDGLWVLGLGLLFTIGGGLIVAQLVGLTPRLMHFGDEEPAAWVIGLLLLPFGVFLLVVVALKWLHIDRLQVLDGHVVVTTGNRLAPQVRRQPVSETIGLRITHLKAVEPRQATDHLVMSGQSIVFIDRDVPLHVLDAFPSNPTTWPDQSIPGWPQPMLPTFEDARRAALERACDIARCTGATLFLTPAEIAVIEERFPPN